MILPLKNLVRPGLATVALLLIPLVAMQFTREVVWTLGDFVVAGALLFGTGFMYELLTSKGGALTYRLAVGLALATALFLAWSNLAVGLIGSEHNPANLLYGGVLATGATGALIARFRPQGMARALVATALAQGLVPVLALLLWPAAEATQDGWFVLGVTVFFVALWLGAAALFWRASTGTSRELIA